MRRLLGTDFTVTARCLAVMLVRAVIAAAVIIAWVPTAYVGASASRIEAVHLRTIVSTREGEIGPGVAPVVGEAVSETVQSVLLGYTTDELEGTRSSVESLLARSLTKMMSGFTVDGVDLEVGQTGQTVTVRLYITATGPSIRSVALDLTAKDVSRAIVQFISEDAERLRREIERMYSGMPSAAISWVSATLETRVRELAGELIPYFDIRSLALRHYGQRTLVLIDLDSRSPVVERVDITLNSDALPRSVGTRLRTASSSLAGVLSGAPVELLVDRKAEIELLLRETLYSDTSEVAGLPIEYSVSLDEGATALVRVSYESPGHLLRAWADVTAGRGGVAPSAGLEYGRRLHGLTLYGRARASVYGAVSFGADAGLRLGIGDGFAIGYEVSLSPEQRHAWCELQVNDRLRVGLEKGFEGRYDAFRITYSLSEAIDVSAFVGNNRSYWIRFSLNL